MKKIAQLHLKNFKAFRDQVFEFGGKNVLIYGNNGSGKSSLFWAIYTFLQSSSKSNAEIQKYFRHFDSTNSSTFESLKNVFADAADDAFVKMKWVDPTDDSTGENIISAANMNTNWGANNPISIANLGSDFINYKLLHNFFQATHKDEINLWEVFLRDIFPFFQPQGRSEDFLKLIQKCQAVPHTGKKVVSGRVKEQFIAEVDFLNNAIDTFLTGIVEQANALLDSAFSEGERRLEIELEYSNIQNERLNFDGIRWDTIKPKIRLTLKIWDERAQNYITIRRPQSFLNEARLTRVALAVRIGALNSRLEQADFKVLCLDDMLISLDMSNRMQVLKWLLNSPEKPYNSFQIILLTHDKAFYEITKHQIEGRQVEKIDENGTPKTEPMKTDWKFWELYNDEFHDLNQPHLATGNSNLELAEKYFRDFEFAACANHLRKECERLIRIFLPENQTWKWVKGEPALKLLQELIEELENHHKVFGKDFRPFKNLGLYKNILMNPLSHDSQGTSVFQHELREIMDDLIPKLQSLKSEKKIEIERGKKCLVDLRITDSAGMEWVYKIEFLEHLQEFTFLDNDKAITNPRCLLIDRVDTSGKNESFDKREGKLNDIFKVISKKCTITEPTDKLSCLTKNP